MKFAAFIIPALLFALVIYAAIKRVKVFDSFVNGAAEALKLIAKLFPFFAAILIMVELMNAAGLTAVITRLLSPVFGFLGIPEELCGLLVIKPFSGSGSLAVLGDVFEKYGADSYVARAAAVVFGSSETVFFIAATYYAGCKKKKVALPILFSLIATIVSAAAACALCRIF